MINKAHSAEVLGLCTRDQEKLALIAVGFAVLNSSDERSNEMSDLQEFFDSMSEHAQWRERCGEVQEAQNIRDRRNTHWDLGVRGDVKYQQAHDPSRSWR